MPFLWLSVYRCNKCGKLVNPDLENHTCGKLSETDVCYISKNSSLQVKKEKKNDIETDKTIDKKD